MAVSAARNAQLPRYVENRHIDHIPAGARHGKPWHQFTFWFGSNVCVLNIVVGAVTVSIGLTFWQALVAIAAGTLIGALMIALHATQGPRLGVPQTIQSRGQFGFYGAAFMFPAVLLINVGYIAAELVIQAQAMVRVTSALTIPQWIVILAVPPVLIGIFGYRWIHRVMQANAAIVGVALVIMFVQGLRYGALPARETTWARPSSGLFLAGVALLVINMLAYGPFVSDYTRYLPAATSGRRLFWGIFAGNVLATFSTCAVGAYLVAMLPALGPFGAVGKVSGSWALVIMAISLIDANTFNAYSGAFQILAFGGMWRRFKAESVTVRLVPFMYVMAAGVVIACLGYRSLVTNLTNFLDVLLVILIPWSAVNLADYFLVRRGRYDVASVLHPQRRLRPVRLARVARLHGGARRRMAVRVPAGLQRPARQDPRRRGHLLAGRLVRRGHHLPASGRSYPRHRPLWPADRHDPPDSPATSAGTWNLGPVCG
jgi:purine-cytosine permease-like protein